MKNRACLQGAGVMKNKYIIVIVLLMILSGCSNTVATQTESVSTHFQMMSEHALTRNEPRTCSLGSGLISVPYCPAGLFFS